MDDNDLILFEVEVKRLSYTISLYDPVKACKLINDDIKRWFRFNEVFFRYPVAIGPANLLKGKMGRCLDQAGIANFAMRSMGIPVTHESTPQWGDRSMGHDFSAVLGRNR